MADEVELKLTLRPHDAHILEACGLLPGKPKTAQQRSVYFDTPGHRLANAGLSLRIRRSGRRRIQTVKAEGASSAGLFARSEWESPVQDDTPIIQNSMPIFALLGEAVAQLAPVFEVHVERRIWDIRESEARIELVLDCGEAVCGDRRSPVCELELELKHGDAAALFAFARKLECAVPVRLGILTKADRGYALLEPRVTVFKAERVVLTHDMMADQAFRHIVQTCLRQFRLNEDLLFERHAPEALHQARVALRRLRSAFSIFKPLLDGDDSAGLREELGWLATELGAARNLDVLLERAAPGPLRDRLETAHLAAYVRVEKILASPRVRALMLNLTQWTMCGAWRGAGKTQDVRNQPAREFATAALNHSRRKVKEDGRDLAERDDQARHEVRKGAKKLRYAAEFFTSLFDHKRQQRRYKRFVAALEALQDQLGALNDLAMAPDVLAKLGVIDEPEAAALLDSGSKKTMVDAAQEAHDALIDTKRFWS